MVTNSFGNRNFMQPMERFSMQSKCPNFLFLKFWVGGKDFFFFIFPVFPTCSFQVPNGFPICSLRVFPIGPPFNSICFAQSSPILTYIGGPKGETLHLSIESSNLGSLCSFNFDFAMGQSNWLIAKNKLELWGTPK